MKRRRMHYEETSDIRKGPWKAEEDEVLVNHVRKYGPRDWSSIRSKGLLQRTGKSCRLRWVNKLRPNLKKGVKFSAEEERAVIDLQAQFGNKWAKIATYLSGRTDNDVKNFWSSRQKRLARLLQTSFTKPHKNSKEVKVPDVKLEVKNISSPKEEESARKVKYFSSSSRVEMQDTMHPNMVVDYFHNQFEFGCTAHEKLFMDPHSQFPSTTQDFPLQIQSQGFIAESNFLDVFGSCAASASTSTQLALEEETEDSVIPNMFMDDFPPNMFQLMEPLPGPSDWL